MSETTADALRRWVNARGAMDAAGWSMQDAATYLRGYDDATKECAQNETGGRDTYAGLWHAIDKMGNAVGADT